MSDSKVWQEQSNGDFTLYVNDRLVGTVTRRYEVAFCGRAFGQCDSLESAMIKLNNLYWRKQSLLARIFVGEQYQTI